MTGREDLTRREGESIKRPELMSTGNAQVIPWHRLFFCGNRSGGAFELGDQGAERLDDLRRFHLTLLKRHLQAKRLSSHSILEDEALGPASLGPSGELAGLFAIYLTARDTFHQGEHFLEGALSNYL